LCSCIQAGIQWPLKFNLLLFSIYLYNYCTESNETNGFQYYGSFDSHAAAEHVRKQNLPPKHTSDSDALIDENLKCPKCGHNIMYREGQIQHYREHVAACQSKATLDSTTYKVEFEDKSDREYRYKILCILCVTLLCVRLQRWNKLYSIMCQTIVGLPHIRNDI